MNLISTCSYFKNGIFVSYCDNLIEYTPDYWLSSECSSDGCLNDEITLLFNLSKSISKFKFCIINPTIAANNILAKEINVQWSNGLNDSIYIENDHESKVICIGKKYKKIESFKIVIKKVWDKLQRVVGFLFVGLFKKGILYIYLKIIMILIALHINITSFLDNIKFNYGSNRESLISNGLYKSNLNNWDKVEFSIKILNDNVNSSIIFNFILNISNETHTFIKV